MVIRPDDRVATVIGRDESLIDVFIALSPAFARLRNAGMRRVMARLVTVEQAARVAGVDATELVARLNAHIAGTATEDAPMKKDESAAAGGIPHETGGAAAQEPAALASIPPEKRVELDVRAQLRAGEEPFSRIMATRRAVPADGAFAVRAIFEPVPLYAVMRQHGFAHFTQQLGDDDWRVWFFAAPENAAPDASDAPAIPAHEAPHAASAGDTDAGVVVLDVRGLEPPEPMMRTLAALEQLPPGGTLVQMNVRVPQFLLPLLEERGFTYEVREQDPGLVRVFIRHRTADGAVGR
jgi:uncharacterized protein (DUF2249 family)